MSLLAPESPRPLAPEQVRVRYTRCAAAPTTSSLTAQLGYLDEEFRGEPGLTLDFASLSPHDAKLNPTREEQFSLRHAGTKTAWVRSQGARLRIVALSYLKSPFSIWALEGSGIESVADLRGRRLAVPFSEGEKILDLAKASALSSYEKAFAPAEISLAEAHLIPVATGKSRFEDDDAPSVRSGRQNASRRELFSRLAGGEVDAVIGDLPEGEAGSTGLRRIFDSRSGAVKDRGSLRALVVNETLLEEKFDWVVRILARHLQAAAWAKAHPSQAIRLVALDHRLTPDALEARFSDVIEGVQLDLAPDKIAALRAQKEFYLRHHFIPNDFDAEAWVDFRPLEAARKLAGERGFLPNPL